MGDANIARSWHTYSDKSVQPECPTPYHGYATSLSCDDAATTVMHAGVPSGAGDHRPARDPQSRLGLEPGGAAALDQQLRGHPSTYVGEPFKGHLQ
jgi:hypothetical protein